MNGLSILSASSILVLATVTVAAAEMQPLKIAKECSEYTGETPSFCTITESNLGQIPVGTRIFYYGPLTANPNFGSSTAVIAAGKDDTALGYCVTYDTASPMSGTCAFHAGSGTLAGFQAVVKVTVDDKQVYHWDGGYLLGATQ
jgi:hypothetical protein